MTPFFQLDPRIESASAAALQQVAPRFTEIDEVTEYNQLKVLRAFMDNGISDGTLAAAPATAMATRVGRPWTKYGRRCSARRTRWCATILPAVPTP